MTYISITKMNINITKYVQFVYKEKYKTLIK